MINYHKKLVSTLKTILPTNYEMFLNRATQVPCISYLELGNYANEEGDTIRYSTIQYQIKVWGHRIDDLNAYALEIDNALKPLGFKRVGCNELYDTESTMIQKIMTYEAKALEEYK